MTKVRKSPTILKPIIDEKMALQFAASVSPPASRSGIDAPPAASARQRSANDASSGPAGKNSRQILLTLKKDLYDRIAKDAARKDRTVEEHLIRHLTKRYGK
jgi:hypothetical protein